MITYREDDKGVSTRAPVPPGYYQVKMGDAILIPRLLGTEEVVSKGGTAEISISRGQIKVESDGTLWDIKLNNGSHYPCAEGVGLVCFDASTNFRHGRLVVQDVINLHQTRDVIGSAVANEQGYSDAIYLDKFVQVEDLQGLNFRLELENDNGVWLYGDQLIFNREQPNFYPATPFYIGTPGFYRTKVFDFSGTQIKFDISTLKAWPITDTINLEDTEVYGDITDAAWRLRGSLNLKGLSGVTGELEHTLRRCSLTGDFNIADSGITGDLTFLYLSRYIKRIDARNTATELDVELLQDLSSMVSFNVANTQAFGDVGSLTNWVVREDLDFTGTNVSGDIAGLKNCNPSGKVGFEGTQVSGDVSQIAHFPTDQPISFVGTNIDDCSIAYRLFPNCKDLNFRDLGLSPQAVDNILRSKNMEGLTNGILELRGNNPPTLDGYFAYLDLLDKGWTVNMETVGHVIAQWQSSDESPEVLGFKIDGTYFFYNNVIQAPSENPFYKDKTPDIEISLIDPYHLTVLAAYNGKLTGGFPDVSGFIRIKEINLVGNKFSGTIPDLSMCHDLEILNLEFNEFDSMQVSHLPPTLTYVDLSENHLDSASIDALIIALDDAGAENGYLRLRGLNMDAPTRPGFEAAQRLVAKGWYVDLEGIMPSQICYTTKMYDFWVLPEDILMGGCD